MASSSSGQVPTWYTDASFAQMLSQGGDILSLNNNSNSVITTIHNHYVAQRVNELAEMALYFQSHSTDQKLAYDNACGQRTPETGLWFLQCESYKRWKGEKKFNLACVGIPGSGKTVMSTIVIDDLAKSFPHAAVIRLFNKSTASKLQSPLLFALNMISQVIEQLQSRSPSPALTALFKDYRFSQFPPTYERTKQVLKHELAQFFRAFIIVDALDEHHVDDPAAPAELTRELEALGVNVLITSRNPVPFTSGTFESVTISASPSDVQSFVSRSIQSGFVRDVLSQRQGLTEEVTKKIVERADGVFLTSKLLLQSMMSCRRIVDIKKLFSQPRRLSTLHMLYQGIFDNLRQSTPWALPLLHFLIVAPDVKIGARAMVQYLACGDWLSHGTSDLSDHVRLVDEVLHAYRGAVVLVDQYNQEDWQIHTSVPITGKGFQFCHLTARESFGLFLDSTARATAQLQIVHTCLKYIPRMLDTIPEGIFQTPDNDDTQSYYLRQHHPLAYHHNLWWSFAKAVENQIQVDVFRTCYAHGRQRWFRQLMAQEHLELVIDDEAGAQVLIELAKYGLYFLLQHHLADCPTSYIDRKDWWGYTAMNYAVLARHHDMMRLLATEKERRSREEILEEVEISPQLVVATSGEHHTNVSIHWAPVEPVYESLHTYFPPDNAYESCSHCAAQVDVRFKWVRGKMIHEGSNAKVYFALKASTRELLVAKQYQAPLTDTEPHLSEMIQRCRLESEILRTLSHHNVVQWIAFDETRSDATVLLEYFPGSNIEGCLERFGAFNEEVTKSFTSQILSGLEYLHSHSIIHANVNSGNILVDRGAVKIAGFCSAQRADDQADGIFRAAMVGSVFWMAPEMMKPAEKRGYDFQIDIWSLGCTVLEMWSGHRPWMGKTTLEVIFQMLQAGSMPPVPTYVRLSELAEDFRRKSLERDPAERSRATELRNHLYLALKPGWRFSSYK